MNALLPGFCRVQGLQRVPCWRVPVGDTLPGFFLPTRQLDVWAEGTPARDPVESLTDWAVALMSRPWPDEADCGNLNVETDDWYAAAHIDVVINQLERVWLLHLGGEQLGVVMRPRVRPARSVTGPRCGVLVSVGLDLRSMAVPLDAAAVRAIRADPALCEVAIEQPPFCGPWGDEPLPEISQALLAVIPDGWVGHFPDRSFHQAEYLIDPVAYRTRARTWPERERSLAFRMVAGAETFARHAADGPELRWRCSPAAFLGTAVHRIDTLDIAAVRREFSVAEMHHLGLYKVHPDEDDEDAFTRVLAQLRGFAEHCRQVAARRLDLIIALH